MVREDRILRALEDTPVPAPAPVGLCEDPDVTGATFLVMEHVDGVSLTDCLPEAYGPPEAEAVGRMGEEMIDGLAELHSVDWRERGLSDFGKPERFLERQVAALDPAVREPPGPRPAPLR